MEELPGVLWTYRTTSGKPTRVSPFTLTYEMEAIIPTEIGMSTIRMEIPKEANAKAHARDLDMTDKIREVAAMCMALYQQRTKKLYNRWVTQCSYQARVLVLRRVFESTIDSTADKFQPNWEGPYTIIRGGLTGSYTLDKMGGTLVPKIWNTTHLKRYYQYKFFSFKVLSIKFLL